MSAMDELLAHRQESTVIIMSSMGEIERNRLHYAACSLVAWPVHGKPVEEGVFADDLRCACRIHRRDVQVTHYHPKHFFVTFSRVVVLTSPRLDCPSRRSYHLRAWDDRREGHHIFYRYRAKLCIEGIPMHARTDAAAENLIGPKCAVHYIEEYSRGGNYNRTHDLRRLTHSTIHRRHVWAQRLRLRQCRWHHECTIRGKQLGRKRRQEGYLILIVWQPRIGTIAVSWTMTGSKVDSLSSSAPSCGVGCKACLWIVLGSWFVHGACRLLFQFQARPKSDSCAAPREVEWGTGNEGDQRGSKWRSVGQETEEKKLRQPALAFIGGRRSFLP
ncbi:Os04g0155550 [Oryza sativa Japonica Group]|uniref:Os04g0155550 protein n=1 Tax=Oryza sativa subsp. japonica TaxID=39947 RepID=A0A0P0W764_ORYSJ|nr:Os04g0155550 [Oryza sativa Japonica Group]